MHVGLRAALVLFGPLALTLSLLSVPLGGPASTAPAAISVGWLLAFEVAYTAVEFVFVLHLFHILLPGVGGPRLWAALFVLGEGFVALCSYEAATTGALQGAALWRITSTFCITLTLLLGHGLAAVRKKKKSEGDGVRAVEQLLPPRDGRAGDAEAAHGAPWWREPDYARWLIQAALIGMLTALYMFCQVFTDLFASRGTPQNAVWLYSVFLVTMSGAMFVYTRVGRAIDRSALYASSAYSVEFLLTVVCTAFYTIFYRNLFTSVDSFTTFFEVRAACLTTITCTFFCLFVCCSRTCGKQTSKQAGAPERG